MWERVDGGYRVLDWEAVEIRLDWVRQCRGEDVQARSSPGSGNTRPWSRPRWPSRWWSLRHVRYAEPLSPHRARGPRPTARRMGAVAQHHAGQHLAGTRARTVISAGQGRRRRPRLPAPCASPRSTPPGSMTMQDSGRPVTLPTATATGTCPRAVTATAPAATAGAWIRTGSSALWVHRYVEVKLEVLVLVAVPATIPLSCNFIEHCFVSFGTVDQRQPTTGTEQKMT